MCVHWRRGARIEVVYEKDAARGSGMQSLRGTKQGVDRCQISSMVLKRSTPTHLLALCRVLRHARCGELTGPRRGPHHKPALGAGG